MTEQREQTTPQASENSDERTKEQRATDEQERAPLFASDDTERFRQRWDALQVSFVDGPREVVKQADELVGELMERLTTEFNETRSSLESQWERGDEVSTEQLRVALTRYRSFFNRLLSV
jgi:hypothetical protein